MNILIIDTEKTYNIGAIVCSEDKIYESHNIVIKENFYDTRICGEANRLRKEKIFSQLAQPPVFYNAVQCIQELGRLIIQYNIKIIIGHNVSEDRIQLGQLIAQASPYIDLKLKELFDTDKILYFDSQKIARILLPNNRCINLKDIIEDITGEKINQSHTALEDSKLVYQLLSFCSKFWKILLTSKFDISDSKVIDALDVLTTISTRSSVLFAKISKPSYTIKSFNTVCKSLESEGVVKVQIVPKIGVNGNALKTTEPAYSLTSEYVEIPKLIKEFLSINWLENITRNFTNYIAEQTPETSSLQTTLQNYYEQDKKQLEQEYQKKTEKLEQEYQNYEKTLRENNQKLTSFLFKMFLEDPKFLKVLKKKIKKGILTYDTALAELFSFIREETK